MRYSSAFAIIIAALGFVAQEAAAHGYMLFPPIRLLAGDAGNGYTYARTANTDPCQNLPAGAPKATLTGGKLSVDYIITAPHMGGCTIYLDRGKGWEVIGSDATCGTSAHTGSIMANIPASTTSYNAVIRWYYQSNNNFGAMGEVFNNCADVIISPTGSNDHPSPTSDQSNTKCSIVNDLQCSGTNNFAGFLQCSDTHFFTIKSCPSGTFCIQTVKSSASSAGSIVCGSQTDFAKANGGVMPNAPSATTATTGGGFKGSTTTTALNTKATSATTPPKATTAVTGNLVAGQPCTTVNAYACNGNQILQCTPNMKWTGQVCPSKLVCHMSGSVANCGFARR